MIELLEENVLWVVLDNEVYRCMGKCSFFLKSSSTVSKRFQATHSLAVSHRYLAFTTQPAPSHSESHTTIHETFEHSHLHSVLEPCCNRANQPHVSNHPWNQIHIPSQFPGPENHAGSIIFRNSQPNKDPRLLGNTIPGFATCWLH